MLKNVKEELKLRLIEPDRIFPIYFALTMAASTLLPWVDAFPHKITVFLFSSLLPSFIFFPPGALFSPTVAAAVAVVYLMCSLRFLIDTETGAIPPISITPWVTALKNCTSIILEICFVLWWISWLEGFWNWAKKWPERYLPRFIHLSLPKVGLCLIVKISI